MYVHLWERNLYALFLEDVVNFFSQLIFHSEKISGIYPGPDDEVDAAIAHGGHRNGWFVIFIVEDAWVSIYHFHQNLPYFTGIGSVGNAYWHIYPAE